LILSIPWAADSQRHPVKAFNSITLSCVLHKCQLQIQISTLLFTIYMEFDPLYIFFELFAENRFSYFLTGKANLSNWII
jgi:hypothetical protein